MGKLFSLRNPGAGGGGTVYVEVEVIVEVPGETIYIEVPVPADTTPELPSGVFGTGVDGDITIGSATTITDDLECENLTLNQRLTLGWNVAEGRPARVLVNDTLTFNVAVACIQAVGATAPTRPAAGAGGAGGTDGGAGATVLPSAGNDSADITGPSIGARGGDGAGTDPLSPGGVGGACNTVILDSFADVVAGAVSSVPVSGGTGGGGGGKVGVQTTGGGGGGGGVVYVAARHIVESTVNTLTNARFNVNAGGGDGVDGFGSGPGSGASGGPGGVIVICEDIENTIWFSAAPATTISGTTRPNFGHIYLASLFASNDPYDFQVNGFYHPITMEL